MFECPPSMRYSSLSTHKAIIYYGTITKCVAAVIVIVVSLYVLYVLKRISNQVLPLNLPNHAETPSTELSNIFIPLSSAPDETELGSASQMLRLEHPV